MRKKYVLFILFGTLLLDTIGIGMVIPIIPVIFTDPTSQDFLLQGYTIGQQYFLAGLITALFGLMQFLASPILGELSDVYGRKKLLTIGIAVLAFSQLLFGFGISVGSIALLLIARTVAGIAGGNFSIAQATIADVSLPEDRAKNFGLVGAAFGIGFILGPLLSGWIAGLSGSAAAPFWVAAALGIINVLSVTFFLSETNLNRKEAQKFHVFKGLQNIYAAWNDPEARPVYLASFLYMCGFAFFTSFIGVLLVAQYGLDESGVGSYFGVVGVSIVVTQLFVLRILTKLFTERQILRYSMIIAAAGLVFYPFVPNVLFLFALAPFFAVPQGLTMANISALVSRSVSPARQGAALGINGSLIALSQGAVPLIAGVGTSLIGLSAPFITATVLMLSAWSVLFIFLRPQTSH
jgi:DHA1 family tetracycline resistance protein-like MFS transporter